MAARSSSALASWRQATSSAWPSRFPPRDHPVLVHAGIPIAAAGALRASVGVRTDASSSRCDTTSSTKSIPAPPCLVLGLRAHAWLHHSIGDRESAQEAQNGKTVRAVCTSGRRKGLTARPAPTLHLSHEANATLTPLGGRVHAAARPGRTPQGPRDPGGFRRTRAAPGDRSGTPPPIIWTA
jgi:hypothetical protein